MTTVCKNCNHHFKGKFCNNCGQSADTHAINFAGIMHELQHGILHIDKGILYTTKELYKRPGHTIREFINGKRVMHFKPFAYIFILSTIYALLTQLTQQNNFLVDILSGLKNAGEGKSDGGTLLTDLLEWMANHYAYATLLLLPVISLASYFSFKKAKRNFFEHLILNSYVAGQRTVAYFFILLLTYMIPDKSFNYVMDLLKVILGFVFTFWAYFQFFNNLSPFKRIGLTLLTYVLMSIFFLAIVFVIAIISALLFTKSQH